jgi:acyl-CoA thioester hydrolase
VSAGARERGRAVEEADGPVDAFVHVVRPRYAEVDAQGVVFNAHWLTYFDESCTRFFEWLGYEPSVAFFHEFDVMLVKAVVEWQGPAGFDERVEIAVTPARLGNSSLDLSYTASVEGRPVCTGLITYVSVRPGSHEPVPIPAELRAKLESCAAV